jgi:hypothetical protein
MGGFSFSSFIKDWQREILFPSSRNPTLVKSGDRCYFPSADESFRQQARRLCPD